MPGINFIGVDVGTGSVRAALVSYKGKVLKTHVKEIQTWNPIPDHFEQSSNGIWKAVCECVKIVAEGVEKHEIVGIGFDATCSLVVLDKSFESLSVSTTGNAEQNIILWMDHRAEKEADFINSTKHELLKYVGGKVSLEMQCPKLLWLKKNMYLSCWNKAGAFYDLPDFLTFKATGSDTRSICSAVCKWNYDGCKSEWSTNFFDRINLSELSDHDFKLIGSSLKFPGDAIGNGLTVEAAEELGLMPNMPVAASMIDAHAGALALLGCRNSSSSEIESFTSKLAIICGTSSCHMSLTKEPVWTQGVWGPYKNAVLPNHYLNEAGQSATGILIDFIIKSHPFYEKLLQELSSITNIYSHLNSLLIEMSVAKNLPSFHNLTDSVHVWPDFHGNRSPLADPNLKGMISGLSMTQTVENLAVVYLAVVQALAYGTKHILDALKKAGRTDFTSILLCGGLSKNNIFVQTHADICSISVLLPSEPEAVLLGASMLGACAAGVYSDLKAAANEMGGSAEVVNPNLNPECKKYLQNKYKVYLKMLDDQKSYDRIMREGN